MFFVFWNLFKPEVSSYCRYSGIIDGKRVCKSWWYLKYYFHLRFLLILVKVLYILWVLLARGPISILLFLYVFRCLEATPLHCYLRLRIIAHWFYLLVTPYFRFVFIQSLSFLHLPVISKLSVWQYVLNPNAYSVSVSNHNRYSVQNFS